MDKMPVDVIYEILKHMDNGMLASFGTTCSQNNILMLSLLSHRFVDQHDIPSTYFTINPAKKVQAILEISEEFVVRWMCSNLSTWKYIMPVVCPKLATKIMITYQTINNDLQSMWDVLPMCFPETFVLWMKAIVVWRARKGNIRIFVCRWTHIWKVMSILSIADAETILLSIIKRRCERDLLACIPTPWCGAILWDALASLLQKHDVRSDTIIQDAMEILMTNMETFQCLIFSCPTTIGVVIVEFNVLKIHTKKMSEFDMTIKNSFLEKSHIEIRNSALAHINMKNYKSLIDESVLDIVEFTQLERNAQNITELFENQG